VCRKIRSFLFRFIPTVVYPYFFCNIYAIYALVQEQSYLAVTLVTSTARARTAYNSCLHSLQFTRIYLALYQRETSITTEHTVESNQPISLVCRSRIRNTAVERGRIQLKKESTTTGHETSSHPVNLYMYDKSSRSHNGFPSMCTCAVLRRGEDGGGLHELRMTMQE
jgi:hypothetical protein